MNRAGALARLMARLLFGALLGSGALAGQEPPRLDTLVAPSANGEPANPVVSRLDRSEELLASVRSAAAERRHRTGFGHGSVRVLPRGPPGRDRPRPACRWPGVAGQARGGKDGSSTGDGARFAGEGGPTAAAKGRGAGAGRRRRAPRDSGERLVLASGAPAARVARGPQPLDVGLERRAPLRAYAIGSRCRRISQVGGTHEP